MCAGQEHINTKGIVLNANIPQFGTDNSVKATTMAASQYQTHISTYKIESVSVMCYIGQLWDYVCQFIQDQSIHGIQDMATTLMDMAMETMSMGHGVKMIEEMDMKMVEETDIMIETTITITMEIGTITITITTTITIMETGATTMEDGVTIMAIGEIMIIGVTTEDGEIMEDGVTADHLLDHGTIMDGNTFLQAPTQSAQTSNIVMSQPSMQDQTSLHTSPMDLQEVVIQEVGMVLIVKASVDMIS